MNQTKRNDRLTILVDGNYLFFRTLFSYEKGSGVRCETEESQQKFCETFYAQLNNVLSQISRTHNLIMVVDKGSWRKELKLGGAGYKAHRADDRKALDINWNGFYECCSAIEAGLKDQGFPCLSTPNVEGDDLIFMWCHLSRKNNHSNTIILSGDSDLSQCVYADEHTYGVLINPITNKTGVSAPLGFRKWLDSSTVENIDTIEDPFAINFDALFRFDPISVLRDLTTKKGYTIEEIDTTRVPLQKALCGDDGDGVPAVCSWSGPKREIRFTGSYFKKALAEAEARGYSLDLQGLRNDPGAQSQLHEILTTVTKKDLDFEAFTHNLKTNIDAVWLDPQVLPIDIALDIETLLWNHTEYQERSLDLKALTASIPFKGKELDPFASSKSEIFKLFEL